MASNPWPSNDNFDVCSGGVCSVYCPQYCYFLFPSPPASTVTKDGVFSPSIIALLGILACAFIALAYYAFIRRYIRQGGGLNRDETREFAGNQWRMPPASAAGAGGLDEVFIEKMAVCRYGRGEELIDGTECAVCLGEFQQDEALRLLPKCRHAFHLPCIDTWLKSHPSCPICRGNISPGAPPAARQSGESREVVLVVVDDREEVRSNSSEAPKSPVHGGFRRSLSLGVGKNQWNFAGEERSMKRSHSTGFMSVNPLHTVMTYSTEISSVAV